MQGLEYGYRVSHPGQIGSTGEAGRPRSHHGSPLSGWRQKLAYGALFGGEVPVGHIALQAAYGHRHPLLSQHASALALHLLGTDPAADSGQAVLSLQSLDCSGHVALTQGQDEGRDLYTYGTALHALGLLALDASFGLLGRLLRAVSQSHLLKIAFSLLGRLLGHLHPV